MVSTLFTAGGGGNGKGGDIKFECKQLEGGKISVHRFGGGGQKRSARLLRVGTFSVRAIFGIPLAPLP